MHCLGKLGDAEQVASNKFEFRHGEILFGKLRPYFHKVGVAPVDGVCSTDILVITPRKPEWFGFVLGHVSSDEFVNYTEGTSAGTKTPRTNWGDVSRFELAIPSETTATVFDQVISRAVESIHKNIPQSCMLAEIRDTLLPKLISGVIRGKNAEALLERDA